MNTDEIGSAIAHKNFDKFKQIIDDGFDVSQKTFSNNTLLHLLACVDWELSTSQSVKSIFRYVPSINDWLYQIKSAMPKSIKEKEFFTLQNNMSQTCMHTAIANENWIFAGAVLNVFCLDYYVHNLYRRNQGGLTELECFLILYGIKGHEKQFQMLFGKEERSIRTIKSASKAFKIIDFDYKNFAVLPNTHPFYKQAVELDYPSKFAEIKDSFVREKIYEEYGLPHAVAQEDVLKSFWENSLS